MALTDTQILDRLDEAWRGGPGDFTGKADTEYHALRLVAGRSVDGDEWFVILERVLGSRIADGGDDDRPGAAAVVTSAYGSRRRRSPRARRAAATPRTATAAPSRLPARPTAVVHRRHSPAGSGWTASL